MSKGILIVKRQAKEDRHSPEFQELLRSTRREAKAIFEQVRLVVVGEDEELADVVAGAEPFLLLLDRGNTLLRGASFRAMKDAVLSGASAAAPYEVSSIELEGKDELFTLGAFERFEKRHLDQETDSQETASSATACTQVLLLETSVVETVQLASWMDGSESLVELTSRLGLKVLATGLAHTFIDYYGEVRSDVLDLVPEGTETVLEVGCGRGATGELLRRELGVHVTGFELNPEVAEDALRRLDEVIVGDVLRVDPPGTYDLVLGLELFEHLTDGHLFLERACSWLKPGGRLVLSVPNVGHWSVVEDLILGRWDYLPIGILCTTHFRFFTRRTLSNWIENAGIYTYKILAQRTKVPERFDALPDSFLADRESLGTKGFWVSISAGS